MVAGIHQISADEPPADKADPGKSALRRHVTAQRSYYRWVVRDGMRSPMIERAFDWLDRELARRAARRRQLG